MKTLKIEFRKMDNEKYNQIIDEAWKKYLDETRFTSNPEWLEPVPVMDMETGEKNWGARQYHRDDFINKCKTDAKFSERWGLLIKETYNLIPHTEDFGDGLTITRPKRRNKLIVVYKNEIIEVYE